MATKSGISGGNDLYLLGIRWVVFLIGIVFLSVGVVFTIQASLGVSPWDVLHIGLAIQTSLSVGTWIMIIGITLITVTCIVERRLPQIGSIANVVGIGYCINIIMDLQLIPTAPSLWGRLIELFMGLLLLGFGSGMYVSAKLGAGPRDGITLMLCSRLGWSVSRVRTIMEIIVVTIGWLIGGPVAIGTLITALLIGPIMQFSLRFWRTRMEILIAQRAKRIQLES